MQNPSPILPNAEAQEKRRILEAKDIFRLQKEAFNAQPFPSEKLRKQQLKALKVALLQHQDKLIKAISADFSHRSPDETRLADIMPTIMTIDHALKHLRHWMQPSKRKVHILFQPAKAMMIDQPLGVVGIMAPWNYPVYMTLGPLVAAIAAGNRAMIKPSEHCPYSNRVLQEIIKQAFSKDEVFMVEGDAPVSAAFSCLPFDHILFTGSTQVGKLVMQAAAKNLTPVTLELGGKSPAIIAPDVEVNFAVDATLFGKCLNAGQTCVAPDYILCPQEKVDVLVAELKNGFARLYPDTTNGDYSAIINLSQWEGLQSHLSDAKAQGATIHSLGPITPVTDSSQKRIMPLQLITDVNSSMSVMQQELFGPILPIVGYTDIDDAIGKINKGARPLSLYLFSHNKKTQARILQETHAGGVCLNDTVSQVAQPDLPFGGIGASGMGSYHAVEGFKTFSHQKPVLKRGKFNSAKLALPPYGKTIHRLIYRWFLGKSK